VRLVFSVIALCALGATAEAAAPSTTDAWIRATPPLAETAAAYATFTSTGEPDRLVTARTDAAERVELHTSVSKDGLMTMSKVDGLAVPANGAAKLAPGAEHLMLIGLRHALTPGQTVTITLVFESAGEIAVPFEVRDARAEATEPHARH
jgi:copper(I)-binding protein